MFPGFQNQSDAEKQLTGLLYDENEHIISSLELNQLASFTYHEQSMATGGRMIYERMIDLLEQVISRPLDVTVLCMHKALVVLRHLLLYGAEKILPAARTLGKAVYRIEEKYNTAVIAQEAAGAVGFFNRLKGGAVDKGGPCREVARQINNLLSSPETLAFERNTKADPNSLVPVGSRTKVGFITDEARLVLLQRRMERERQVQVKSNLAKSDSAFGSGYTSKDGAAVVGAAHTLDEMIKEAEKKEQAKARRFTDAPKPNQPQQQQSSSLFSDYQAPDLMMHSAPPMSSSMTGDLLSMDNSGPPSSFATTDLLGFGAPAPAATADLLGSDFGGGGPSATNSTVDIFGATSSGSTASEKESELLSIGAPVSMSNNTGLMGGNTGLGGGIGLPMSNQPMSATQGQIDRFAALDALNPLGDKSTGSSAAPAMKSYGMPQQASMNTTGLNSLANLSASFSTTSQPAPSLGNLASLSSLRVSSSVGPPPGTGMTGRMISSSSNISDGDDDGGGFVMGGTVGTGLEPLGPAPAAPPPPPP